MLETACLLWASIKVGRPDWIVLMIRAGPTMVERTMRDHDTGSASRFLVTAGVALLSIPLIVGGLNAPRLRAQSPVSPSPAIQAAQSLKEMEAAGVKMSFDVASVKPNNSDSPTTSNIGGPGSAYFPTGGLFSATNKTLINYISFAYDLTSYQFDSLLSRLPKWATLEGFDIQARAKGNPTREQLQMMMQSLLADRFKLAIHTETKEGPVYALVLAKPGKTGPQLQPDREPCPTEPTSPAPGAPPPTGRAAEFPAVCGLSGMQASALGRLRMGGKSITIELLADIVPGSNSGVERRVVDRTGLTGNYDFTLEWAPQINGPIPPGSFQPDPLGPTYLQALQEQLGLKLEPQTGPVTVYVVDHVEEPSPN